MRKITDKWLFVIDNDGYQIKVISGDTVKDFGHVITDSFSSSLKGVIYRAQRYYLRYCRALLCDDQTPRPRPGKPHYLHYTRALLCDVQVVGSEGDYSLIGRIRFVER